MLCYYAGHEPPSYVRQQKSEAVPDKSTTSGNGTVVFFAFEAWRQNARGLPFNFLNEYMSWKIYVIHFSRRFKHARHYTGIAEDVAERHARHCAGRGAKLIAAAVTAGVKMGEAQIIGEFPDYHTAHAEERRLKNRGGARRICPKCKERRQHELLMS